MKTQGPLFKKQEKKPFPVVSLLTCHSVFLLHVQTLTGARAHPATYLPPALLGRLLGWGAVNSFVPLDFVHQTQVQRKL